MFSDSEDEEGEAAVVEKRPVGGGGAVVRSIMRGQEEEDYVYAEVRMGQIGGSSKGEEYINRIEGGVRMPSMRLAKTFDFDDSEEEEEEQKQSHS
jgi:hypothetical protein